MSCDGNASTTLVDIFTAKAASVGTTVTHAENIAKAAQYALRLCSEKVYPKPSGEAGAKTLAAPEVAEEIFASLTEAGKEAGVEVIGGGLRSRMGGVNVGFTVADMAIAETGTAVLRCFGEDLRLATMICEAHVLALPKSRIAGTSYEAGDFLREAMANNMYAAFISGCSRTSDIERVLTLGVHGPVELHIVLTEEE